MLRSSRKAKAATFGLLSVTAFAAYVMGSGEWAVDPGAASLQAASAATDASATTPNERLPTYFPNTEELRPDEMRVTALGT